MTTLTAAQSRALEWLPSTGEWRVHDVGMGRAIDSMKRRGRELIQSEYGAFGPRGGHARRWRLTPAGIALKAEWEAGR